MERKGIEAKVLSVLSFVGMIVMNILANVLPINGMTTGEISDMYPTLFTPAGYTFSIWWVIYTLLMLFTIYQMNLFRKGMENQKLLKQTRVLFMIMNLSNAGWILAWHYGFIALSVMLMLIILICLIAVNRSFHSEDISGNSKVLIKVPFQIYYGWITVATVANITVLLVSVRWNNYGIKDSTWMIIVLILLGILVSAWIALYSDVVYGITILWALLGILVKHISKDGYHWEYPEVINTLLLLQSFLVIEVVWLLLIKRKQK